MNLFGDEKYMFIDLKKFLLNFFYMIRFLFFICIFNLFTSNLIFASEGIRSQVEYNQILNISKKIIDSEDSSEYSLRMIRDNLVELRAELLLIEKKQLYIINNINEQLDAVALPSINEEFISDRFKTKLLSKGPSPLNIFSWNVTWSDLIKIKNEIITQLDFSNIATILGNNVAFFNPFILMVVGLLFIYSRFFF